MIYAQESLVDEIIVDNFAGGGGASRSCGRFRSYARTSTFRSRVVQTASWQR